MHMVMTVEMCDGHPRRPHPVQLGAAFIDHGRRGNAPRERMRKETPPRQEPPGTRVDERRRASDWAAQSEIQMQPDAEAGSDLSRELDGLIAVLDNRERKIISERFGLDGAEPKTLEDVGKNLGVTRERIRQLQNVALSKLRRALIKKEEVVNVTEAIAA